MKNVFGKKKGVERLDGDRFVDRSLEGWLYRERDEILQQIDVLEKAACLPFWLNALECIALFVGFAALLWFVLCWLQVGSFGAAFFIFPWLLPVSAVGLFAGFGIVAYEVRRAHKTAASPAVAQFEEQFEKNEEECREQLRIPDDTDGVDVFLFPYRVKDGKEKISPIQNFQYMNMELEVFREGDTLCFSDLELVVKIPLCEIYEIARIDKKVLMWGWNKETSYKKGEYKPYKIRSKGYGSYSLKPYYSLRIRRDEEEFEILIPGYEIETILSLTGMQVTA